MAAMGPPQPCSKALVVKLPTHSSLSTTASSHHRVGLGSSNKTRTYGNSLDSATSAEEQATRHRSVSPGRSKLAEVTSLVVRQCNPPLDSTTDSIIRETNERATPEDSRYGDVESQCWQANRLVTNDLLRVLGQSCLCMPFLHTR